MFGGNGMLTMRAVALAIVLLAPMAAGCSGCADGSQALPAATVGDATGTSDAPSDRGGPDAAGDVATTIDDAGWATPGWLPPGTHVEFATDPATMVPSLPWQPCADGTAGCQEFDDGRAWLQWRGVVLRAFDGVQTWFDFARTVVTSGTRYEVSAYAPIDGPTAIAWRMRDNPRGPYEGDPDIWLSGHGFLSSVTFLPRGMNPSSPAVSETTVFVHSDPSHPLVSAQPFFVADQATAFGGDYLGYFTSTATAWGFTEERLVVLMTFGPPVRVQRFSEPTGALDRVQPVISGDSFFWQADFTRSDGSFRGEVWARPDGGPSRQLIADPVGDVDGFDTDGTTMVWVVGFGNGPTSGTLPVAQLWTAPFTTDPTLLRPRRLATFTNGDLTGRRQFAAGRYALASGGGDAWIFDVATGAYWHLFPPPGETYIDVVFLNPTEVGLTVRGVPGGGENVRRLRLDSLGPMTPGSGDGGAAS